MISNNLGKYGGGPFGPTKKVSVDGDIAELEKLSNNLEEEIKLMISNTGLAQKTKEFETRLMEVGG